MTKWTSADDLTKALAEFIATFVFVFIGVGAVGSVLAVGGTDSRASYIVIGLGHGLGIMLGVLAVGRISGAHLNPAVTIAALVTGNISVVRSALYIAGQLAGAVLAIAVLNGVAFDRDELGLHQIAPQLSTADGLVLEIFLTFILVWTIFATAIDRRGNTALTPFAIGMAITVGHFIALGLTGASMNPARSFGPAAFFGNFNQHWVYWAGPITGGILAALVYVYFFGDDEARKRVGRIKLSG